MKKAVIVISDLHVGSTSGLCPPDGFALPDGARYMPNIYQLTTWKFWEYFWNVDVPKYTKGARIKILAINGDAMDGVHHKTTSIISNSWEHQENAAVQVLKPVSKRVNKVLMIRGTEVHVDAGAQSEERIAKTIGAEENEIGEHSSWQWWVDLNGVLFQFAHHIGVTSSAAYETSAPMREMIAGLADSVQWGRKVPDVFVRSHRHRFSQVSMTCGESEEDSFMKENKHIRCVITPGWQLRTSHVERIDRMRMPHIGGVIFMIGDDGTCLLKERIYPLPQPKPLII